MIYKLTSAKSVIAKVYRDFKPTIPGWELSAIEWIGEAVEAIGVSAGLTAKSSGNEGCDDAVSIVSHRAKLPCDLVNLLAVEYSGRRLPYGGDITAAGLTSASRTTDIYTNRTNSDVETDILPGVSASVERVADSPLVVGPEQVISDYYIINPSYIQTSFETGHLKLHYEAYPTDNDGYPYVPDHYYYLTAITWYIMSKLCLLGYQGVLDFNKSHQFWCEYKLLAQNKAMFPSIDKMERFRNMWVRLIPNQTLPDDFFAGGETAESIKYV